PAATRQPSCASCAAAPGTAAAPPAGPRSVTSRLPTFGATTSASEWCATPHRLNNLYQSSGHPLKEKAMMIGTRLNRWCLLPLAAIGTSLSASGLWAADAPAVRELRIQRVGETTYFQVRFRVPADMQDVPVGTDPKHLARQPRLVPQDGKAQAVYHRFNLSSTPGSAPRDAPAKDAPPRPAPPPPDQPQTPASVEGLEFVGTLHGEGRAKFLLLYPVDTEKSTKEGEKAK